jgi:hypothetical protein
MKPASCLLLPASFIPHPSEGLHCAGFREVF